MTWLQHVNIVVPPGGTGAAVDFYAAVFGLQPVAKPDGTDRSQGAWLALEGKQLIHISERDGQRNADAHFAVVVDDFEATRQRMDSAGATWTDQADIFGGRRGFTRDPAGNRIEVLESSGDLAG